MNSKERVGKSGESGKLPSLHEELHPGERLGTLEFCLVKSNNLTKWSHFRNKSSLILGTYVKTSSVVVNCWNKRGPCFLPLKCFSVSLYKTCASHIVGAPRKVLRSMPG